MNKIKCQLIFIAIIVLSSSHSFCQDETPNFQFDSTTNKITFSEVIFVDSITNKIELFSRAREWFAKTYISSVDVIQMEDKESGKIIGKAQMQVYHKSMGGNYPSGKIHYTISIYVKDNRYKYIISDFYHTGEGQIPDYGQCEDMINTKDKAWGMSYQKMYNYYLYQLDTNIKALIIDLKSAMLKSSVEQQKGDW